MMPSTTGGHLVCINENLKFFTFSFDSQVTDILWIRFLQELDAYNESKIAKAHLCPDGTTSWHFQIINLAMELDRNFLEVAANAPILISITINDSKGASLLFDKAVNNFPDNWKILFHAAYQALFEEKNLRKAADLLNRSGINGAPNWVFSLAGGLYNQIGLTKFAESIYYYLSNKFPEEEATKRLKDKLEKKTKNFYQPSIRN